MATGGVAGCKLTPTYNAVGSITVRGNLTDRQTPADARPVNELILCLLSSSPATGRSRSGFRLTQLMTSGTRDAGPAGAIVMPDDRRKGVPR